MNPQSSILLVGNFDGVHIGHQALIAHAQSLAQSNNARVGIITFQTHPATLLAPNQAPEPIQDTAQKQEALLNAGADEVHWLQPTPEVLGLSPEQFIEDIVAKHRPIAMVEGSNFLFGKDRAGDVNLLKSLGEVHHFDTHIIEPVIVTLRDKTTAPVSSSLIRWLLQHGRVADANLAMGRPTQVRGQVVRGEQRGRSIGFPTANLQTNGTLLPADGIYGGTITVDGRQYTTAISIGTKPTFHAEPFQRTFEAHILDFDQDIYDQTHSVDLLRWVRDQVRFPNVELLVKQIECDVATIRELADKNLLDPKPSHPTYQPTN